MTKKFLIALLILVGLIFSIFLLHRLLRPERPIFGLTEIERVFPGGEVAFVKTEGFINVWNVFKDSNYYRERGYRPLLTIPGVYEISQMIEEVEEKIGRDVNFDLIMYLLGRESAVGFYVNDSDEGVNVNGNIDGGNLVNGVNGGNGGLDYLVVARVYPEILFVERLATFFVGEKYIKESKYLGLIVKEIEVKEIEVKEIEIDGEGEKDRNVRDSRKIIYALDGDFLILSGDRELFRDAVGQYIDKKVDKVGRLSKNKTFLEAKERVDANGNKPYILGFVDLERLKDFPSISGVISESEKYLSSDQMIFNALFDVDGDSSSRVTLELELRESEGTTSKKFTDRFLVGSGTKTVLTDDALISMSVNDFSFLSEAVLKESSLSEEILFYTVLRLFKAGFSIALVRGDGTCPGLSAWGKSPPGAMKIIEAIVEKNGWAIIESEIDDLKLFSVVEAAAPKTELIVFTFNDDILFVGDRGEIVTSLVKKVKVEKTFFSRFKRREEGLRMKMMPGPLWKSIDRCPTYFELLITRFFQPSEKSLPFKKRVEFIKGLYPVDEFVINVVPGGEDEIKIEISADFKQPKNEN